ncbi:MAG: anaerobic ribonucleoside-triphosphate reductase activating protein [Spirochaetes bacterium]|nr:MAG: anaerobic ribonucleoside-triphosphate reductase activating protein [Spirochaetota bacterium]
MPLAAVGLQKTTLIDFPGEVACTVFTAGCNLRCPYCHNPELVSGAPHSDMLPIKEFRSFLLKRKAVLGGVCITGGEPLLHQDIDELIDYIHELGLKVKIDTNGTFPELLRSIKPDYIAMDVKTSLSKYHLLKGNSPYLEEKVLSSLKYIISSGIPHEFRTTVVPGIVDAEDIREIVNLIRGADRYVLAGFRGGKTLDPSFKDLSPYPPEVLDEMKVIAVDAGLMCHVRANLVRS